MTNDDKIVYNNNKASHKYKSWIFTWNAEDDGSLIEQSVIQSILSSIAEDYVFQQEMASRLHYQGLIIMGHRVRKATLLNMIFMSGKVLSSQLKNLTIENIKGTREEAQKYVTKSDTRVSPAVYSPGLLPYQSVDVAFLSSRDKWYHWQDTLYNMLIKDSIIRTPDDRTIIWLTDKAGNSGKSKFVKYLCLNYPKEIIKVPFGSSTQIRSAICSTLARKVYFIDLPRVLGKEDSILDILSVIEDVKNGFVVSAMYGKYVQMMFEPPHIVIFSNMNCPTKYLSSDRWKEFTLEPYSYKLYSTITGKLQTEL